MIAPAILFSQEYLIKNFTRENGLPNNYIYNLAQGQTGLLWIATETGLCTFNGNNFNLNPISELTNEEIIELYLDKKNRLWFLGLNGSVHILQNGELNVFQNEYLKDQVIRIAEDPLGNIWMQGVNDYKGEFAFDPDMLTLKYNPISKGEKLEVLKEILKKLISFQHSLSLKEDEISYENLGIKTSLERSSNFRFFKELIPLNNKNWIFRSNNRIFIYETHTGILRPLLAEYKKEFDKGLVGVTLDKFKNLWITKKLGVMLVKDVLSAQPKVSFFLDDVRIGECIADRNGNLWASSHQSGLYMLSSNRVKTLDKGRNECATSIYKNKDYLVYGTLDGEVVILDNQLDEIKRIKLKDPRSKVYKIEEYSDNKILAVSTTIIELVDLKTLSSSVFLDRGFFKNATLDEFETLWINGGLHNYIYNNKTKDITITDLYKRSYSCLPLDEDAALFGTIKGLYKVNKSNKVQKILGPDFSKDVRHIIKTPDSLIVLSTQADGIYIVKNDSIVHHLLEALPSQNIRKAIYVDSTLWVASNNGLTKVQGDNLKFTYKTVGQSDGMPSSSILDIYSFEDKIYCATEDGIGIIDKNIKFDEQVPTLQIENVKINGRDTTLLDAYDLNQDQSNIQISFNSIYYNNPESVKYKYKLSGLNIDWIQTDQTYVQYPSLPAGKYRFFISTKSLNSKWSKTQSIEFKIPFKFTETILFQLLRVLLIAGAAIFIFNLTLQNREKKRALKVSQLSALRTQMNPHFIFNSLNSVQDYILNDDKRAANKYISQFSKLMRYILNTSNNEFTQLNQELQALELYLSIESMRFDNTLKYKINIKSGIDPRQYKIPIMMIQPFVENAIRHGLIHAKGEKNLYINVDKMDKGLYFEIIDNGIGRVHSRMLNSTKKDKHDSKGNSIIDGRIELLNKAYGAENKVTFEDIYDKQGNPTGTIVKLKLQSIKFTQ